MFSKSGELRDGELLGARVETQVLCGECVTNGIRLGQRSQIVDQCFALLSETQFHKIQKSTFVRERQFCAITREAKGHQCRANFGRRAEGTARNAHYKFRTGVELRDD